MRFIIVLFAAIMFLVPKVHAQSAACSADTWAGMTGEASLQAQVQTRVAQALINKPDSVMEYSCFHDRIQGSGALFSGDALQNASINNLVLMPLGNHLGRNFGHTLAGGELPGPPGGVCSAMNAAWEFSKCENIDLAMFVAAADLGPGGAAEAALESPTGGCPEVK